MAGFNTPQLARTPSSQQPKEMSNRLLNMKVSYPVPVTRRIEELRACQHTCSKFL